MPTLSCLRAFAKTRLAVWTARTGRLLAAALGGLLTAVASAQPPPPADTLVAWADVAFPQAFATLDSFLRIPNASRDLATAELNAAWCERAFRRLGFRTERLATPTAPFVFAERRYHPAGTAPTLLFYLQIDGQPVDSAAWSQPDPYTPVLKRRNGNGEPWQILADEPREVGHLPQPYDPDWRLFGRSTSDSKGPAVSLIAALGVLEARGRRPAFDIKVIMDLEEEIGSPHLPAMVRARRELLDADALVIMDGTRHLSNRPTLTFGARGIAKATLTVFGPREALHSGQYGNYAPNPAFGLARLLAGMKDTAGRVTVPGWYAGVDLTERERTRLRAIPDDEPALLRRIGVAAPERVAGTGGGYQEALQYPSLNVRGLRAAWVGEEVRTLIPDRAVAELDLRLVPETPGARQVGLLRDYVRAQGYHLVAGEEPTDVERARYPRLARFEAAVSYEAFRTPYDAPVGRLLTSALTRAFGESPVAMRTTGGSQPMGPFVLELGLDAVALRIPNPDNNIHAPDENLRLGNFWEGLVSCLALLTEGE